MINKKIKIKSHQQQILSNVPHASEVNCSLRMELMLNVIGILYMD